MFSHMFLLFQLLLPYFSIFAKLLLTNYFAPFSAAQESDFSSRFLYLWHYNVVRHTCAPIFQTQNALVSQSKTLSVFCRRFLKQTSIGQTQIIPFLLTKILKLTLSCMTSSESPAKLRSTARVQNPQGVSKLVNKVDCRVPHTLLKAIVRAFLAKKSFAAGSSTYPCHTACISKSVPRDVISSSDYQGFICVKQSFDGTAFASGFLVEK